MSEAMIDGYKKMIEDQAKWMKSKEKQKEYNRKYHQSADYKEKLKIRYDCPCGQTYVGTNKVGHTRGRLHKQWDKLVNNV
jgi:hypothetical protein